MYFFQQYYSGQHSGHPLMNTSQDRSQNSPSQFTSSQRHHDSPTMRSPQTFNPQSTSSPQGLNSSTRTPQQGYRSMNSSQSFVSCNSPPQDNSMSSQSSMDHSWSQHSQGKLWSPQSDTSQTSMSDSSSPMRKRYRVSNGTFVVTHLS